MACRVLHFCLSIYNAFEKPADITNFHERRYYGWPSSWQWLTRRTTGELSSAWNSDLFTKVLLSHQLRLLTHAFQNPSWTNRGTGIAASKLIWTAVILNSSDASGLFIIVEELARWCLKSFGGQRGVRANPLEPPLPTGLTFACICKL